VLVRLYACRNSWRGVVLGLDGADVVIRADGQDIRFPFRSVVNAKLVLTDKLIQEDLKARKERPRERERQLRSVGESRSDE
jgi:ribosome maturation factor RimP